MSDSPRKILELYTGALCTGNPIGTGGWGSLLRFGSHTKELFGHQPDTTLERMELFALISALGALKEPCKVKIFSSSKFLLETLRTMSLSQWMGRAWKKEDGTELPCRDLLMILYFQSRKHQMTFVPCVSEHLPEDVKHCMQLAQTGIDEYVRINTPISEDELFSQLGLSKDDLPEDDENEEAILDPQNLPSEQS